MEKETILNFIKDDSKTVKHEDKEYRTLKVSFGFHNFSVATLATESLHNDCEKLFNQVSDVFRRPYGTNT